MGRCCFVSCIFSIKLVVTMLRFFLLFAFTFSAIAATPVPSDLTASKQLSSDTKLQALAFDRYWLKLNHYRAATRSAWKTEIDTPDFFLSSQAKTDPLAELLATVSAFRKQGLSEYQELVCRFPARFLWLNEKLGEEWPSAICDEMKMWRDSIQPQGLTLVFPTAFMNNPSSMFGHTLLRVDAKDQTRNKALVAFAVNFAALPDNSDDAATYALKGLAGQYPGAYSLMPYYEKVKEYSDLESRDMWEYKLNLTEKEVNNVLIHLWELKDARFDYFFIDENCSYQLLSLLQVAREGLELSSQFDYHVIPSDTVAVLRDVGLLNTPEYRPSSGTRLLHYSKQLTDQELTASKAVMLGEFPDGSFTIDSKVKIYEMAYEWLNYRFYDERLLREKMAPLLTKILIARSQLRIKSVFTPIPEPIISPEQGHGSARLGLGLVGLDKADNVISISGRLNYHDLFDAPGGFIPGAQISFFDTELRINDSADVELTRLYLMDALSLPVDNTVFDSWSWNARVGMDRQPGINKLEQRWFGQTGYGKAWGAANKLHSYALFSGELVGGDISYRGLEVGAGIETGAIWQANPTNRIGVQLNHMYLIDSDVEFHTKANLTWHWTADRDFAVRSEVGYLNWRSEEMYAQLTGFYYF